MVVGGWCRSYEPPLGGVEVPPETTRPWSITEGKGTGVRNQVPISTLGSDRLLLLTGYLRTYL